MLKEVLIVEGKTDVAGNVTLHPVDAAGVKVYGTIRRALNL